MTTESIIRLELAVVKAAIARYGGGPFDVGTELRLIAAVEALVQARKEKPPQTLWGLPVVVSEAVPADPGFAIVDLPRMIKSNDVIEGVYALMEGRIQMEMTENDSQAKYRVEVKLVPVEGENK